MMPLSEIEREAYKSYEKHEAADHARPHCDCCGTEPGQECCFMRGVEWLAAKVHERIVNHTVSYAALFDVIREFV